MLLSYVYKLRPSKEQAVKLNDWINILRSHYNWCLSDRIATYYQQFIQGDYCDICSKGEASPLTCCVVKNGATGNPWKGNGKKRSAAAIQDAGLVDLKQARPWLFLLGWLLEHCLPLIQADPKPNLLAALRKHYLLFGYRTCISVLQIHQMPGVAKIAQQELLARMMSVSMPNDESLETASTRFMTALLPALLAEQVTPWQSWADVLYTQYPKGWDIVQARAVGRYAVEDRACLSGILNDLLTNNTEHFRRNFIALSEALQAGGEATTAQLLVNVKLQTLEPSLFVALMRFLREVGSTFSSASQEQLAQWLKPLAHSHVDSVLTVLNSLADGSLTARQLVVDLQMIDHPPNKPAIARGYCVSCRLNNILL